VHSTGDLQTHRHGSATGATADAAAPAEVEPYQLSPACATFLGDLSDWGLDVFALESLAAGRPLTATAMLSLHLAGVFTALPLDMVRGGSEGRGPWVC
jgi:hypothetical protein